MLDYDNPRCAECGKRQPLIATGSDLCECKFCPSCGYPHPERIADNCGYCQIPAVRAELGFKPLARRFSRHLG